ncbi:MAG: hypothetical protein RLP44_21020 [Aggregatilineales bacterium]
MTHWKIFLAGIMLIIAILACNTQVNMSATPETASLSCEPTIFTLRGEVDYNWHMTLEEGTPYAINIRTNPETNTYQLTSTFVRSDALQEAVLIPAEYTFSEDDKSATTVFTAPAGIVDIVVYSLIGEDGNDLGEHIITLCPLD